MKRFSVMFQLETDDGTTITKTFTDKCINNPINDSQKLLDSLKEKGSKAMLPASTT
ncbi:Uncharacterised protein [uncultured archaeon]|nr:Uncharacterised protein [uncultured archaeon]